MSSAILLLCAVLFSGLAAGLELTVRFAVRGPLERLDVRSHVLMRQGLVRTLRILAPALVLPAIALGVLALLFAVTGTASVLVAVGLGAYAVWLAVTFGGTVPINAAALDWDPDAPPADLDRILRRWERLALVRVVVTLAAAVLFATALLVS
jgi:hypothetical protein